MDLKPRRNNQKSFFEDSNIRLATILSVENIPAMNPSKLEIDAGELVDSS
ncbi:MAG: hypothetical protein R2847_10785 [Bacteroidia bacterium]